MTNVSQENRLSFYQAALAGLRFLDLIEDRGRRFGPEADALWSSFAGHLHWGDRIDLLLNDGFHPWGAAFAPRIVFGLSGAPDDDPFGPDWQGLEAETADALWKEAENLNVAEPRQAMRRFVTAWFPAMVPAPLAEETVRSGMKLAVGGVWAILHYFELFLYRPDLSWTRQVTVFGESPGERHLAGLVGVLLRTEKPTLLGDKAGVNPAFFDLIAVSDDADHTVKRAFFGSGEA